MSYVLESFYALLLVVYCAVRYTPFAPLVDTHWHDRAVFHSYALNTLRNEVAFMPQEV